MGQAGNSRQVTGVLRDKMKWLVRFNRDLRPLGGMPSSQERLYHASRLIESVAACILDYGDCGLPLELFDALELAGRLELAVRAIRAEGGAVD